MVDGPIPCGASDGCHCVCGRGARAHQSGSGLNYYGANDFTHPTYRALWELVTAAGGPSVADAGWASRIRSSATDPVVTSAVSALGVEPLLTAKDPDDAFVAAHVYRLQELTVLRRIAELKSRLQRTNPVEQATDYNKMFGELVALEQRRRSLRELAMGTT